MTELKVAVLGGGSWGTTVAALTTRNAPVTIWARKSDTVDEINREHRNHKYLPDAKLPESLRALANSSLAEQLEQIKLTPDTLGAEEISKLWAAFQSKYRPTFGRRTPAPW